MHCTVLEYIEHSHYQASAMLGKTVVATLPLNKSTEMHKQWQEALEQEHLGSNTIYGITLQNTNTKTLYTFYGRHSWHCFQFCTQYTQNFEIITETTETNFKILCKGQFVGQQT